MVQRKRKFCPYRHTFVGILLLVFMGSVFVKGEVYAKAGGITPKLASKKQVSLKEGSSSRVKVSGKYIVKITYTRSNKLVAAVNKNGKITAKNAGTCKVKAEVSYRKKRGGKIYKKSLFVTVNVRHKTEKKLQSFIIRVNGKDFTAKVYDTKAGREFYAKLPKTVTMSELNGNEKYYYTDSAFTEGEKKIGIIKAGDLMLYGDNCLVLFYDTFRTSYEYTRIGYIENPAGLAEAVGKRNAKVTFLKVSTKNEG